MGIFKKKISASFCAYFPHFKGLFAYTFHGYLEYELPSPVNASLRIQNACFLSISKIDQFFISIECNNGRQN